MTYEEKIKRLRTARNTLHRLEDRGILENNLSTEQITAIRIAEYALDELPLWIPCSERLPEDNTTVLYVWRSENGNASVFHGWHGSIRGLGSAWHQSGVGMQRPDDEVTHWMPLPEPPKGGDTP